MCFFFNTNAFKISIFATFSTTLVSMSYSNHMSFNVVSLTCRAVSDSFTLAVQIVEHAPFHPSVSYLLALISKHQAVFPNTFPLA